MKNYSPINFVNGYAYLENIPTIICPLNTMLLIYNFLDNNEKIELELMTKKLKNEVITKFLRDNSNIQNFNLLIKKFIKLLSSTGVGNVEIIRFEKNNQKYIFKCYNPIFTKSYHNLFKKNFNKYPPIIKDLLESFIETKLNYKVISNYLTKNQEDYFQIKITKEKIENEKIQNQDVIKINKNQIDNPLLKKVIINDQIKNCNGEIKIWNMNVVLVPSIFLETDNEKIINALKIIGKAQGKTAFDIMAKIFGNKEPKIIFDNILNQSDLVGIGKINLIKFNLNEKKIIIEIPENLIKNKKLTSIGTYVISIIEEAIANIFNKKIEIELKNHILTYTCSKENYEIEAEVKEKLKYLNIKKIIS